MATYTGLFLRLKDKQTSVPDKLKLAKFAWVTDAVHIPNKHQQILDFICGLLVNKRKHGLQKEDAELIWETLDKFLCVCGSAAVVKPSILQAVIEDLGSLICKDKPKKKKQEGLDDGNVSCIIRCTKQLLLLPTVTASQFENLCALLSVVCKLLTEYRAEPERYVVELRSLLESIVCVLEANQRLHLNQSQVLHTIIDKLLSVSLKTLDIWPCQRLQDFLLACLLHVDHQEVYTIFLQHVCGEPGQGHIKQAPKSVSSVFAALSSHFMQAESTASTKFLSAFMETFVHQNKSNPRLCYLLLRQLVKILTPDNVKDSVPPNIHHETYWGECVSGCVRACQGCDLFTANNNSNDVLRWFCQLTELMLEKKRLPFWFNYMDAVLPLNHLVIEKYWSKILDLGLTRADQIPEESHIAQDQFLADFVSTYLKLRRTPDLLSALLSAIETSASNTDVFGHLSQFYDRMCTMFNETPLASVLDMWEVLQDLAGKLTDKLEAKSVDATAMMPCLQWTLSYYTILLGNARLFDHRSVSPHSQRINLLMKRLEQDVLLPLHKKKEVSKHCAAFGELLSVWTVVRILLFPKWRDSALLLSREAAEDTNMGCLDKLSKKSDATSQALLAVQRQHLAPGDQLASNDVHRQLQTCNEKIAESLLDLPSLTRDIVFKPWMANSGNGCSALQQPSYQFQQFINLFPLVGKHLTESAIIKCVDVVVRVLSFGMMKDLTVTSPHSSTLFSMVMEFLIHPATREVKMFQEQLVLDLWKALLSGLTDNISSPKKKRLKTARNESHTMLDKAVRFLISPFRKAEKFALCLADIDGSLEVQSHFPVLIKMLSCLDLDYLPEVNLRCQIGACVVLACLKGTADSSDFKIGVAQLLIQSLSTPGVTQLCECVEAADLVDFVIKVCSQNTEMDLQLLEVTIQMVMNDREAVLSLPAVAKKIVSDLQEEHQPDTVRMKTVAHMIKNCRKYVTKSFHIPNVRSAALEIFFCLAKFIVKNGLEWFKRATLAQSQACQHQDYVEGEKLSGIKKKKRKRTQTDWDPDLKRESLAATSSGENPSNRAWCSLLECVSELLQLWASDAADDKFNNHLVLMVDEVMTRTLRDLKSGHVSFTARETKLRFIEACCHCHLRCSQAHNSSAPLASKDDLGSVSVPPSSDSHYQSPASSDSFCLLPVEKLEEIWTTCFSACALEFTNQLKKYSVEDSFHSQFSRTKQHTKSSNQTKSVQGRRQLEFPLTKRQDIAESDAFQELHKSSPDINAGCEKSALWLPDRMDTWPRTLIAYVDVLTAILECSDVAEFCCMFEKMLKCLHPSSATELSMVYTVMAVWRKLLSSRLMSDDHIKEMFKYMYQFLSALLGLLQHFENMQLTELSPASQSFSSSSESSLERASMHVASRFMLDALSDFVDLGKMLITPRMTLLCLHAGVTFTLTCPLDLEALYRLTNTLLVHHTNTALRAVPAVLNLVNKLISSCITLGSEDKLAEQPETVKDLAHCAQLITRLLTLLSTPAYKVDLAKVAHTILAEYVIGVQKCALHTLVKKELVQGLYKLMSVCDKFRLAALNAALPPGVKDIFKFLHQDYEKYHRYKGVV